MKTARLFLTASIMIILSIVHAGPGDTIVVQTIDHSTPVNPGWNAPREGFYLFPPDTLSFEKILMYYTLQCDPSQYPPCGEWDYTTHTYLHHHTGQYDSNLYYHPNYMIAGAAPDSFMYMDNLSWEYEVYFNHQNNTPPGNSATTGNTDQQIALTNPLNTLDGSHQFLFTAQELTTAGLNSGELTGIELWFSNTGQTLKNFTIQVKHSDLEEITPSSFETFGFSTVYKWDFSTSNTSGYTGIPFAYPFVWDGNSNIVINLSYQDDHGISPYILKGGDVSFNSSISSISNNYCLEFDGDFAEIDISTISSLDSAVTIAFWSYGTDILPVNNSIIHAVDQDGNRVLNVHLPWSNGRVYWDAGYDGGYDRIDKAADPEDYKNRWNYWVFTKDVITGNMFIYLNGLPWHIGSGKTNPLSGITKFYLGAGTPDNNFYPGKIDELSIWNAALDMTTISQWMHKEITTAHPFYSNLLAYYKFNEGQGTSIFDSSSHYAESKMYGYPLWTTYKGSRITGYQQSSIRPSFIFQNGNYDPQNLDSVLVIDTIPQSQVMIVMYGDPSNPTQTTDTIDKWPHYYEYTIGPDGIPTDTTLVSPDGILYRQDNPYYIPYEIVDQYELGRYITPYGNGLSLGNGFTWIYDVTDFVHFLHDTVHLTAGNFQELLDLEFHMIEGTPPRDVINLDRLWHGYFALNNFDDAVPADTIGLPANAESFRLKIATSGHEWDNPTNCAEFCQKTHWVDVDGITQYEWEILDECSTNPLYPQGGTWIYDRAGWCPGAKVTLRDIEITQYITSDTVILDYNCDPDPYGRYIVSSYLVSYAAPNFSLDAAIEDVLKPNARKFYGRFNPICGKPLILIRNTGADTLTSLNIEYGPEGGIMHEYQWEGSLAFNDTSYVELPPVDWTGWTTDNNTFTVSIDSPNGGQDEYAYNNTFKTDFELTPEYPDEFVIYFKTNLAGYQNRYEITDAEGNVILEKDGFGNSTQYTDTVMLSNGCYKFTMYDSGDNGISFWANNQGSGFLYLKRMDGTMLYNFKSDFGRFISQEFTVGFSVNIVETGSRNEFRLFPNPTQGLINCQISFPEVKNAVVSIINPFGQTILYQELRGNTKYSEVFDLTQHENGLYLIKVSTADGTDVRKIVLTK